MPSANPQSPPSPSVGAQVRSELRASFRTGKTRPVAWRLSQLETFKRMLIDNQEEIIVVVAARDHKNTGLRNWRAMQN